MMGGNGMGMFGSRPNMLQQMQQQGMFGQSPMPGVPMQQQGMPMPQQQIPTLSPQQMAGMFGPMMARGGDSAPGPIIEDPAYPPGPQQPAGGGGNFPTRIPNSHGAYFDAAIPAGMDYAQIAAMLDQQLNRAMRMKPRSTASKHFDVYDVTGYDRPGKGKDDEKGKEWWRNPIPGPLLGMLR